MKKLSLNEMATVNGGLNTCDVAVASYAFGVGMMLAFPPAAITVGFLGLALGTTAFGMFGVATSCQKK